MYVSMYGWMDGLMNVVCVSVNVNICLCVCVIYACMRMCGCVMYVCVCVCVCMYVCVYACMCLCMCVCMHACVCVCVRRGEGFASQAERQKSQVSTLYLHAFHIEFSWMACIYFLAWRGHKINAFHKVYYFIYYY